jgi:hypothetical protein
MNQVTLHCPHCGAQNRPESYFCNMCAAELRSGADVLSEGFHDPWRIPLIAMSAGFGTVAVVSVIALLSVMSQRPMPTQSMPSSTQTSTSSVPPPIATSTPLPSPSAVVTKKSKVQPSPLPSDEYPVPMGEPEYEPTPYRSETRTIPPPMPRPKPTEYYSPPYGHTYIRGPRGGCYYINRNGNKTYVDRSMCN